MEVDLAGQAALVRGGGTWARAVAERLECSGARVLREPNGALDILVNADPVLIDGAGSFDAVKAAFALLGDGMAPDGRVVNIGSVFGLVPPRGGGALAGACAALWARTRAAALDLAPRRIRVNGVAVMAEDRPHTPLRRAASPEDAAVAALFLLAPASSYVTGEIVRVDGGWSVGYAREF